MTDQLLTEALLEPCPWCAETNAIVCRTDYGPADLKVYAVSCQTRDCHGAIWALGYGLFPTPEQAIAAWNTRAAPNPVSDGWRTIESAPHSERVLVIYNCGTVEIAEQRHCGNNVWRWIGDDGETDELNPGSLRIGWQHLPPGASPQTREMPEGTDVSTIVGTAG